MESFRCLRRALLIIVLLSWGCNLIPIGALSAEENDPRTQLTEMLFKAVKANDMSAARTAIEAGAELARINLYGQTAMDIAISNSHFEIANYLVFARRIEQQVTLNKALLINSVQQVSPEAAPVVSISIDSSPAPQQTGDSNNFLSGKNQPKKRKKLAQSTIKKIRLTTKKLDSKYQAVTKISKIKAQGVQKNIQIIRSNTQQEKLEKTNKNGTKQKIKPAKLFFFMDADGNLIKSSAAEIRRIQESIRQKVVRMLPDIEPRKSLFIPKPRLKPSFVPPTSSQPILTEPNSVPTSTAKQNVPDPKKQKSELSKKQIPDTQKPSNLQIIKKKKAKIDYIRPTRRISPELLNKLRRGLEETKHQHKVSIRRQEKNAVEQIIMPSIAQPVQKKKIELGPLPTLKVYPKESSKIGPELQLNDKNRIEKSKLREKNFFEKFFNNFTNFFGITSEIQEAKKNIEPSGNKAQIRTLFQKSIKSEEREIKTIEPSAIKRRSGQLSFTLNPREDGVKTKPIEETGVANNQPSQSLIKKSNKNLELNLDKKETPKYELSAINELRPNSSFNTNIKQTKSYRIERETNNIPTRQPTGLMPLTRLRKPLKNISLTLGNSVTTGQSKVPHGIAEPNPCIQKRRGKISFCIIPIDWPQKIENAFSINTSLYQGTRAIARYDENKATHFHVLYRSAAQSKIIDLIIERYGPPTETWKRTIAPFGKPRQSNPTYIWRSHDIKLNQVTILEVRKFDDSRTVFPDTKHGAIRLYIAGGPPVFPIVTAHDIMSIDWAARSDHHFENGLPALARTIRVQP